MSAGAAATEPLSGPIPAMEVLLAQKRWPTHLSPRLAVVYRAALTAAKERRQPDPVAGVTVRQAFLRVHLRFVRDVTDDDVAPLEALGCRAVRLPDGAAAKVGPVIDADCDWRKLAGLKELTALWRVTPTLGLAPPPPLPAPRTTTLDEVEVSPLAQALYPSMATGKGVTVLDIDTAADIFHPYLFRADGGRFTWLDVNGDGDFDPGVDAVDLNGDGDAQPAEVLLVHKATITEPIRATGMNRYLNTDSEFEAGVDWLFTDDNGNRLRDLDTTFDEQRPGYGENVFVIDDVNGNRALNPGEKLVRLGTSKLKAVLDFDSARVPRTWVRGENLTRFAAPSGTTSHATMVLGSLAGGDARFTRYRGVAPDAELLLAARTDEPTWIPSLAWGEQQGAHLALWEQAQTYWEPLDGSSDLEAACDSAHSRGVLQLAPAGNMGGLNKHRVSTVSGAAETFQLAVPVFYSRGMLMNFNSAATAASTLAFTLRLGNESIALAGPAQGTGTLGPYDVEWFKETSMRGTVMVGAYLLARNQTPPTQDVLIDVEVAHTGDPATVHSYVFDLESGWSRGAEWTSGTSDAHTYGSPATSDKTLAIAAYYADFPQRDLRWGDLTEYNSRGPRIDGLETIDFVVPEDHLTARASPFSGQWGDFEIGGGTSNAAPLAVGVAALLKGQEPSLTADGLTTRLKSSLRTAPQMGLLPNDQWGGGIVSVYRAVTGLTAPPTIAAPTARGLATWVVESGELALDASASSDSASGTLTYQWDLDDDGTWDTPPMSEATFTVIVDSVTSYVRLEVANAQGSAAATMVKVGTVSPLLSSVPMPVAKTGCGCSSGGLTTLIPLLGALTLRRRTRKRRLAHLF